MLLLEVDHPRFIEARDNLGMFAELVKSPEHIHTYKITELSLWNACSAGWTGERVVNVLRDLSKYPILPNVERNILDFASRYGRVVLSHSEDEYLLKTDTEDLAEDLGSNEKLKKFFTARVDETTFSFPAQERGRLKLALIKVGFPAHDLAGYKQGETLKVGLREKTLEGLEFGLRPYQEYAVDAFYAGGTAEGGSGVITLPCGAGKTVVGLASMRALQTSTLILVTNTTAARQWIREILDKTTLTPEEVGEYTGYTKDIRQVTIATYQIMTWRKNKTEPFKHMELFNSRNWGLIIYDEVHMLPAPVFQYTADIQARRRLGLTATLVREDGLEEDVFALIGPKKMDVPWKEMELQGWIAVAVCSEIRVQMNEATRREYIKSGKRARPRVAAENNRKTQIAKKILANHQGEKTLLIGTYVDQLKEIASGMQTPIITGQTSQGRRDELFSRFRDGDLDLLVVSKVANFAVDLPDASVAIQVSGSFGSRQEEAQRLGRLLRPKKDSRQAHFYSLVTEDTVEQDFAMKRQLFLVEQGYQYLILDEEEL